ncbi:D-glycerate dehydrogenase [Candidatus Uhrbacteria bacterium]|nr:D-glycerate dehydrogenase [Candidatus Uhrbacteria bacterium]
MFKVFVTYPIPKNGIEMLKKAGYKVTVQPFEKHISRKELITKAKGSDAVLTLLTNHVDAGFMDAVGKQLRVISNFAVGYDNIDVIAAKARGIVVANTPCDEVSSAVAEHTIALLLALARNIVSADLFSLANKYKGWDPRLFIGTDISGKTLGLVGLGRIGKCVARRLERGFDIRIIYTDTVRDRAFEKEYNTSFVSLEVLLKKSDIVSLHVPLLPSTYHLVNAKKLTLMKKDAFLINTARGGVVDQSAVLARLSNGLLGGFAMDVFECEPHIAKNSKELKLLRRLENVVITPHIASATKESREAMARIAAQNIIEGLSGKLITHRVVNT